jgi:hypothetical protein
MSLRVSRSVLSSRVAPSSRGSAPRPFRTEVPMRSAPPSRSVPVLALTGFLGAGKTTVLNSVLRAPGARFGVVVNDFGTIDVDAALLSGQVDEAASIAGGCLCCLPEAGGLDEALAQLSRPRLRLDAILVEASGVAEPLALARLLEHSPRRRHPSRRAGRRRRRSRVLRDRGRPHARRPPRRRAAAALRRRLAGGDHQDRAAARGAARGADRGDHRAHPPAQSRRGGDRGAPWRDRPGAGRRRGEPRAPPRASCRSRRSPDRRAASTSTSTPSR